MSEEFKRKLKQYADGTLPDQEREEMERELEKMEAYQAYLEEVMTASESSRDESEQADQIPERRVPKGAERRIIRKGKWKARLMNGLTGVGLILLLTIISGILTGLFYGTGEPDRMTQYRDAVASAIAVSRPNVTAELNGQGNAFFSMDLTGKLMKQIGDSRESAGELSIKFLMSLATSPQISWRDNRSWGIFHHPAYKPQGQDTDTTEKSNSRTDDSEWATLDKLPEGTVAEVFISMDRLIPIDELLQWLEPKNLEPVWFAADVGPSSWRDDSGIVMSPIGFPYQPLWHPGDMKVDQYSERKTGWFGKVVMSSSSSPSVKAYGDGELRGQNFLQTLKVLQQYKSVTRQVAPFIKVDEAVDYVEKNGVQLYGLVLTGPSKELLKLKQEPWVRNLRVGEVRLWNWNDRQ
ncbi:anti-sigma factor [Paenibacillus filicis]|uniref:Anti-sigma factor n=1 Tax=Paenibacillus filicis TaxID=669464 RepID=A0ABU9DUT8_9BACL